MLPIHWKSCLKLCGQMYGFLLCDYKQNQQHISSSAY